MKRSHDLLKLELLCGDVGMQELGWVFGFSSNISSGVVDLRTSTCPKSVCYAAGHNFIIYDGNTHTQVLFYFCSLIVDTHKTRPNKFCVHQLWPRAWKRFLIETLKHVHPADDIARPCAPDTVSSCCTRQKMHPYLWCWVWCSAYSMGQQNWTGSYISSHSAPHAEMLNLTNIVLPHNREWSTEELEMCIGFKSVVK
jgi:hypothetical protein